MIVTKTLTWTKVSEAAEILNIGRVTLYNQIKQARNFPQTSPFKKNVCWKKTSIRGGYQINVDEWDKVLRNF